VWIRSSKFTGDHGGEFSELHRKLSHAVAATPTAAFRAKRLVRPFPGCSGQQRMTSVMVQLLSHGCIVEGKERYFSRHPQFAKAARFAAPGFDGSATFVMREEHVRAYRVLR
jgi:hypothetical protein